MQQSLSVGLSALLTLQRRLDTVANNIANQSTAGFRAEEVTFASVISHANPDSVAFAATGKTYTSRRQGEISQTGSAFDVAISGDAWLATKTPAGVALTRDGRLKLTPVGELQTVTGLPILDAGGSPVQLDPNGGSPIINRDGTVSQAGRVVGAIGLYMLAPDSAVKRIGDAGLVPGVAPVPSVDQRAILMQGYVERSNVDPVREMTRLIQLQRTFDAITAATGQVEASLGEAIRTLGS
jgi:flagellar basal-body rod protein FlgF